MQIATQGVITNEYDQVLLIHRNDTRTLAAPGGSVESGELPTDGVVREVREETGLIVMPVRVVELAFLPIRPAGILTFAFRCIQRGGELTTSEEALKVGFYKTRPLPSPMISFHRQRLQRALRHSGGAPRWGVDTALWWEHVAKFLLFNVVYRYMDLKRFIKRQPPFQPAPNWSTSAYTVVRNNAGEVLWKRETTSGIWSLPGDQGTKMIPPWETAQSAIQTQCGLTPLLKGLAGVYSHKEEDRMEFIFTADAETDLISSSPNPHDLAFFAPGQEPPNASPQHIQWVADAVDPDSDTVFRHWE